MNASGATPARPTSASTPELLVLPINTVADGEAALIAG
jgi:hypothetical protein